MCSNRVVGPINGTLVTEFDQILTKNWNFQTMGKVEVPLTDLSVACDSSDNWALEFRFLTTGFYKHPVSVNGYDILYWISLS